MSAYLEPAANVILGAQEQTGPRFGATVHLGTGSHRLAIGIYTARSMSGLLRLYEHTQSPRLLEAVERAMPFLNRLITDQGTLFGYYHDGRMIANPRWISPSGDMLRIAVLADAYGLTPPGMIEKLVNMLLRHQLPSGAIPTAYGFTDRGGGQAFTGVSEFRDILPAVGWCDKVLRALALLAPADFNFTPTKIASVDVPCVWKGKHYRFVEDTHELRLCNQSGSHDLYRWRKGSVWPSSYAL
jgi:hypothetical protein